MMLLISDWENKLHKLKELQHMKSAPVTLLKLNNSRYQLLSQMLLSLKFILRHFYYACNIAILFQNTGKNIISAHTEINIYCTQSKMSNAMHVLFYISFIFTEFPSYRSLVRRNILSRKGLSIGEKIQY